MPEIRFDDFPAKKEREPNSVLPPGVILNALEDPAAVMRELATIWNADVAEQVGGVTALTSAVMPQPIREPVQIELKEQELTSRIEQLDRELVLSKLQTFVIKPSESAFQGPYVIRDYVCNSSGPIYERILHADQFVELVK
jgi:hypothetical protein